VYKSEIFSISLQWDELAKHFTYRHFESLGVRYFVGYNSFPPQFEIVEEVTDPHHRMKWEDAWRDNSWYYLRYLWHDSLRIDGTIPRESMLWMEPRTDNETVIAYVRQVCDHVVANWREYRIEEDVAQGLAKPITKQWIHLNRQKFEVIAFNGYDMYFVDNFRVRAPYTHMRVQMLRLGWKRQYGMLSFFYTHSVMGRDNMSTLTRPVRFPPYASPRDVIGGFDTLPSLPPDDRVPLRT
jgi:hypothetical protein